MQNFYLLFLGIVCWACTSSSIENKTKNSPMIAIVAQDTITQAKLDLRTQLLVLDSVPSARQSALFQLLKMYGYAAIVPKYGYVLTDSMLQWEIQRIDSSTLMPEKLQRIKEICQTREMYQEVFVKESLYPRWLKVCFDKDEKQQRNKAVEANEIFTQALLQANLFDKDSCKIANSSYAIHTFWLSENSLESIQKTKTAAPSNFIDQTQKESLQVKQRLEAQLQNNASVLPKQLYALVQKLQKGQLHPKVIDAPDVFWILKYCEKKREKYKIKLLEIPKNNFSVWLDKELKTIDIQVVDTVAWKAMQTTLPISKQIFSVQE